ncbi:ribose-phosphate pyrophosphokinase [Haploplasma axanthum]|uniref:Ribose-phosphate pyrophosphokinase n=2 Tax=Haploplasma axanthum TaxID=29552 RepID=A0A449BBD1_HAPAX|nr:ribose-phosphate pyrophosphokinase [Haploplasma axanthum]
MSESMGIKRTKLFALSSNKELAELVSRSSGLPLSEIELFRFSDGEIGLNISESVRGCDVFVVQSTSNPTNENLMELLIFADAVKRASAKSLTVIMPYYGYSRQDRKAKSRQPITAKLVADLLQIAGIDRIISIDLHAAQIQGFFNIPIDNFPAAPLLANYFLRKKQLENIVVVSPDHGGATRARKFAKILDATMAIIDKRRPEPNRAEVMSIIGDVKGKVAVIIDDMIDTAGTLVAGAEALLQYGATEVYAAATHPIFSGQAIERINASSIKKVVVTDTIKLSQAAIDSNKIVQVSMGNLLGESIRHIIEDKPISQIFDVIETLEVLKVWVI